MIKYNLRKYLSIFVLSLFLCPCAKKTHTITILYDRPPRTLDPHRRNEIVTISILSNIYQGLIEYTPDLRLVPCLARNWYLSDSLTWVFDLREGVHFHNGEEFRGRDAVYSLYRTIRNNTTENATLKRIVDTIYAAGPHRLIIKTRSPYHALLNEIDRLYIVPEGYENFSSPIGTGPFKATFISDDSIVCVLFQYYWGPKPPISRGVFKFIPEFKDRLALFRNCKNCVLYGVPISVYTQMKDSIKMIAISGVAARYLQMDIRKYPFNQREFRNALSLAIDRAKLNKELYQGLAQPANQFIPRGMVGYCPDLPPLSYNPDSAVQLIKKFGNPEIHLYYGKAIQELGTHIASFFRAVGVRIVEHPLEAKAFWEGVEKRRFDCYLISALVTTLDGLSTILEAFFYTYDPQKGTGLMNRSGFSNRQIDSLINCASQIADPEERLNIINHIQKTLLVEMPIIPILWEPRIYGLSPDIDFVPRIDQTIRLAEIKFKK
ncbi:MAG: ABC transporter substrate-binding protein [candidate division WOR-3 bacterium]